MFLRYLHFSPDFFRYVGKQLDQKAKVQTGTQTITINILPCISKTKGNQTMKFGELIEYSVGNIFLQKSCTK